MTGLSLIDSKMDIDTSVTETVVEFSPISDAVLHNYLKTGEHKSVSMFI